jgi:hypothetical protein
MIRIDLTDVNTLVNIIGAKNCESTIYMDLLDDKRSDGPFFKACRIYAFFEARRICEQALECLEY